jgi:GTPase SAR1 family protein
LYLGIDIILLEVGARIGAEMNEKVTLKILIIGESDVGKSRLVSLHC